MALLLLAALLALLCPRTVQLAGVLELRVLSARGSPGGPCGGPPSCRLVFRLCLRPPTGIGCSLGAAHSPPGPPPTPGAPRILRLPFAFPWPVRIPSARGGGAKIWTSLGSNEWGPYCVPPNPHGLVLLTVSFAPRHHQGTVSLVIESWRLEEAKDPGSPQGWLLGRAVARQHLVPGEPWRGGAGGGLRFSTRVRCHHPARGPRCLLRCPPCARRCPSYSAACHIPLYHRCWPRCCAQGCGADGWGCVLSSANSTVFRSDTAGLRCDPPSPGRPPSPRAPEAAKVRALEPLPEASPSPCALGPCFNGGACAPAPLPGTGYSCRCPPGFHGSNCERHADRCADHVCLHGGHCLDLGHSVICKCRPGFSGGRCEHNVDDCSPNPCANGGTCVDGANSYSCSCTLGYAGADCRQRADACASGPCLHGATCYTHFSGHVCACPPGYMGPRCEEEVGGPLAAPQRQPPAPLALACALPIALLGPGLGLVLAARGWRRRPLGESGRTLEPVGTTSLSLRGTEQQLPRASATQV